MTVTPSFGGLQCWSRYSDWRSFELKAIRSPYITYRSRKARIVCIYHLGPKYPMPLLGRNRCRDGLFMFTKLLSEWWGTWDTRTQGACKTYSAAVSNWGLGNSSRPLTPPAIKPIDERERICSGPTRDPGHPRMARAIHGWPDIPGWPGYGRPTVDPWMAWVCSGPTGDPGHPGIIHLV